MEKICIEKRLGGNLPKMSLRGAIMGVFIFLSTSIFQIFSSEHTLKKKKSKMTFLKTSIKGY